MTATHATISPIPGPGYPSAAVCRDHTASRPRNEATVEPASAIQASAHRRVTSARIEKPTLKTSTIQVKTREGSAMALSAAASVPTSTSNPRVDPVCGSTKLASRANTRIATTMARAPGSISRAMRRSTSSNSPSRASSSRGRSSGDFSFIADTPPARPAWTTRPPRACPGSHRCAACGRRRAHPPPGCAGARATQSRRSDGAGLHR